MGVHQIKSQSARTDTGVTLSSVDRETMRADYRGRRMIVPVDRGLRSYGVYLGRVPVWDDGEPITAEDLAVVKNGMAEVLRHWGKDTEFVVPDGADG
ncbi:hypothetical protein [Actinoplanes utahensis]|uniref:Uncharacterized protein n=1 Tax=Actinoplanes utahensis TaxID=1869 RepID=A0A0A6U8P6_ACTUT|nr:hypothetical protein [Actinoplanes utahensis]KHD72415.1 hypothetical protein MB27_38765 [Actinoplanes utahensis]GIF29495.1 hypothetical protein Aut01nite_24810 [Actinoplanes utahensis]